MTGNYTRSITRQHRTAFVLLLDSSGSMSEQVLFDGREVSKACAVAEAANRFLFELTERARRDDGIRDYYDIAVLSYHGDSVESLLSTDGGFISISELASRPAPDSVWSREHVLPDGRPTILTSTTPRRIEPRAEGRTPMYEAMLEARDLLRAWCADPANADSFPPVVINITDGEFSDCDEHEITDIARQIRSLATSDGNVLLLNIHIASGEDRPVIFPSPGEIADAGRNARIMADCSSRMPEAFEALIGQYRGPGARPPYIGMSLNAPANEILNIINIGSISANITT
ncbi:MAG: VWA domain-containing protein [Alistipes sp.]|nr:VWA domain-containing protein [Alistipes sp.]